MEQPPLRELDTPAEETRRDRLLRESFVLGFVVLLVLVLGMGTLCVVRLRTVESAITARGDRTRRELELLFDLERRANRLSAEVITLKTAISYNSVTFPAAHRVAEARKELENALVAGRDTPLGATPEWKDLDRAFEVYVASLDPAQPIPVQPEEDFQKALQALEARIRQSVALDQHDANELRDNAIRDVKFTTAACLIVGLVVSALSFVETRRRIAMIRGAFARVAASKGVIESTLEGMDSAVLTLGLDGSVTRINGAGLHVLGYRSPEDVVGKSLDEALSGQPALLALVLPLVEARNPGRRYLGRVELGRERWLFEVGASPLTIAGEVRGYIVTLTDVTLAERANEELRRNRALVAVGQMTAQVAHEIKNPLGGVRLAAQVLARKLADDPESLDVIRRIESSVDHLNRTVAELNQFARPKQLDLGPVRLGALLDELLPMVGDTLEAKQIRVERRYDPSMPEALFDPSELRKAFLNFLINAIDASPDGGVLELAIETSADVAEPSATVVIRDHGHGMDEETLRRLFEPFYTTKSHGTGLGMAIARKIVELHKGSLSVSSVVAEGTTVSVQLPLTLAPAEAAEVETIAEERG